jgi:hypothetical protein
VLLLSNSDQNVAIAYIYLAEEILPYSTIEKALKASLEKINNLILPE